MRIVLALSAVMLWWSSSGAEEWTRIDSSDPVVALEYERGSIKSISPSERRVRTRFVSKTGGELPLVGAYSVVSETEYYCPQPLEKLLSAVMVTPSGVSRQTVESPVYSEIEHGSNSYRLWREICFAEAAEAP